MLVTEWDYELEKKVLRREAWEDGFEEGFKRGIKEVKEQTARAMKAEGMDINFIAEVTGLTVDDILQL